MSSPVSPPAIRRRDPRALPPYLSNGVLGVRSPGLPHLRGTTMVNGFSGLHPSDGVEGFARAPYALAFDVTIDRLSAFAAPERVELHEQRYDFETAELTTTWTLHGERANAHVQVVAFCSRTLPAIAAAELSVELDGPADLEVTAGFDATDVPGVADREAQPPSKGPNEGVDGVVRWQAPGRIAELGVAYSTRFRGDSEAERRPSMSDQRAWFSTTYALRARADRTYRLALLTGYVPDLSHHRPDEEAGRIAAKAADLGFERLQRDNREAWRERWRSRIVVAGADARWQAIVDASVFYLLTSVHASALASISLFGLAYWPNYHYYHGHVMWDIETFTVPPLVLLDPPAAHALLDFRLRHLDAAQHNAALHGWRGALYPWEACPLHGEESTPGARPYTEDHVTSDVALAFAAYVHATGDLDYARRAAWPVLRAVGEWAASRVIRTPSGFELRGTVGPRESYEPVDNDAYTNLATARALQEAIACARLIGEAAPSGWQAIADGLVVPRDRRRGAIVNHEHARLTEVQGGVPEGAAALFPAGYAVDPATARATYRYAAVEQAPLYVGAPMLSALMPVFAARAGLADRAANLLEPGYGAFITEPFREPAEHPVASDQPVASPMFANLSGFISGLLYGFTRLRLDDGPPESWASGPTTLPAGWRGIEIERLWVRGAEYSLRARGGSPAELRPLEPAGRVKRTRGRATAA
ncbi:MAG TPA: hypothetical protein VGI98_03930 [Candidatus Limnocylindrales bacterium]